MRFLRSMEGKTWIKLTMNTSDDNFMNNRVKLCNHPLKMNKD